VGGAERGEERLSDEIFGIRLVAASARRGSDVGRRSKAGTRSRIGPDGGVLTHERGIVGQGRLIAADRVTPSPSSATTSVETTFP